MYPRRLTCRGPCPGPGLSRNVDVAEFSKIVNNRRSLLGTDNSIAGSLMSVFTEAGVKKYLHKTAQLIGA